jgi:hypothetical protein
MFLNTSQKVISTLRFNKDEESNPLRVLGKVFKLALVNLNADFFFRVNQPVKNIGM